MIYSSIYYQLSAFSMVETKADKQKEFLPGVMKGGISVLEVKPTTLATLIDAVNKAKSWHEDDRDTDTKVHLYPGKYKLESKDGKDITNQGLSSLKGYELHSLANRKSNMIQFLESFAPRKYHDRIDVASIRTITNEKGIVVKPCPLAGETANDNGHKIRVDFGSGSIKFINRDTGNQYLAHKFNNKN